MRGLPAQIGSHGPGSRSCPPFSDSGTSETSLAVIHKAERVRSDVWLRGARQWVCGCPGLDGRERPMRTRAARTKRGDSRLPRCGFGSARAARGCPRRGPTPAHAGPAPGPTPGCAPGRALLRRFYRRRHVHGAEPVHHSRDDRRRRDNVKITGHAQATVTNQSTGASVSYNISGPGTVVVYPDGAFSIDAHGPNLLWTRSEFSFPGIPTISYTTGHVTVQVAASGQTTSYRLRGRQTDVCAVLAS